ncbi:DNA-binding protein, partial [Streptomyces sp. SID2131]|nr:DNA-binding protein [Streptomyces sp. SID2131]
ALGLASAESAADHWRRVTLHLATPHLHTPDGQERGTSYRTVFPLGGGAVLGITENDRGVDDGREFEALLHDPDGRFEAPAPYTLRTATSPGDRTRGADWLTAFLREAENRAEVPLPEEAAEEFSRLTGVPGALARLVLAGMPNVDDWGNNFLPTELRTSLGLKVAEAAQARDELRGLSVEVRRAVVAALLPEDPARLWTEGPDAASAAAVWNAYVGRRTRVPDWLIAEADRGVVTGWSVQRALSALLGP